MTTKKAASAADQAATEAPQPAATLAEPVEQQGAADEIATPAITHSITAVPATGFCRAGRRWYREATEVSRADFDDAQWAALESEPMLVVTSL